MDPFALLFADHARMEIRQYLLTLPILYDKKQRAAIVSAEHANLAGGFLKPTPGRHSMPR